MAWCYRKCCLRGVYKPNEDKVVRTHLEITSCSQLQLGDHISFRRNGYKHHAIVSGIVHDTRFKVIHLTGNSTDAMASFSSANKANVSENAIDFDNSGEVRKYDHSNTEIRPPHVKLEVAKCIYDQGLPKNYNFLTFNCEHFASYCATGIPYCKQSGVQNNQGKKVLDELIAKYKPELSSYIIKG